MGKPALQWTSDMLAQLGQEKDAVLAERWGTTAKTVNLKRNALGIAAFAQTQQFQWTAQALALLGTMADAELAQQLGISKASVVARRLQAGVASVSSAMAAKHKGAAFAWTDEVVALLGTASDAKVAAQLGLSRLTVYNARVARGIAAAGRAGQSKAAESLAAADAAPAPAPSSAASDTSGQG